MTPRTRAIIAVHLFGAPAAMRDLLDIARRHGVRLIEDACEAVGARYDGRRVGGLADAGVFGFYPNKVLTTGEGGMLVSDSDEVVQRSRAIANQGRDEDGHFVGTHGFSFRTTELGAALGRAQLDSLDERLDRRAALAKRYDRALGNVPGVATPSAQDGARSWFVYPVRLDAAVDRDRVMRELATAGIETAAYFPAIHQDARLRNRVLVPQELPVSEALGRQLLSLPFWLDLTDADHGGNRDGFAAAAAGTADFCAAVRVGVQICAAQMRFFLYCRQYWSTPRSGTDLVARQRSSSGWDCMRLTGRANEDDPDGVEDTNVVEFWVTIQRA